MDRLPFERFNTFSHLSGLIAASISSCFLFRSALLTKNWIEILAVAIYGVTTVALFFGSTLYHAHTGSKKKQLQLLDHILIFIKIAGNFTPFMLISVKSMNAYLVLAVVWLLAIIGILLELQLRERAEKISLLIYLVMSLSALVITKELLLALPIMGFILLMLGGFFYLGGLYFFINDAKIKHGHGYWHLCVIAGSFSHYFCLQFFVV